MMHISKRDAPIAGGSNSSSAGAPEIPMAPLTTTNMDLIARVFKEFRKNACLPGDDRISESFIKAGRQLLGAARADVPIDMVLYCPNCGTQHVDAPTWERDPHDMEQGQICTWANPPHRSHLCSACETIWRPADVATNGVAAITTEGKADTWPDGLPDDALAANAQAASELSIDQIADIAGGCMDTARYNTFMALIRHALRERS
jgi:hypothetical protein